jgi:myo-inositol 2-dehydrogenase/D-chiro-inositol 1-dehydrogenase
MMVLKIALIGLGRAGRFHLNSIRRASGIQLKYVVDLDSTAAEAVAAEFGCSALSDTGPVFQDPDIDAVIVATPTLTHYDYVMAALQAGKSVLTEKPLGVSLKQIDECYQEAEKKDRILFLAFNRRFDPSFSQVAQRVKNGDIGTVQIVRTTSRDHPLPSMDYIKTSCGIFHDCIVHDLDMLRFLTGEDPEEVFAYGSNFIDSIKELDDLDTVIVQLKFASGMLATIDISRNAVYGYDQRVEVFGSRGMLQAENRIATTTVHFSEGSVQRPAIDPSFPTRYQEGYFIELVSFRDCVLHGKVLPITHADARKNYIMAHTAEESCRSGKPMKIDYGCGVSK